jgi:hypothetical protein
MILCGKKYISKRFVDAFGKNILKGGSALST